MFAYIIGHYLDIFRMQAIEESDNKPKNQETENSRHSELRNEVIMTVLSFLDQYPSINTNDIRLQAAKNNLLPVKRLWTGEIASQTSETVNNAS